MAGAGVLIPVPLVVQVKPGEPCCPVVGFWAGLVGGPAPNTTPADGSTRQAPIAREANRCFISALPFKTMLRIGDRCLETLRRAYWQRSSVRMDHRRPGGGACSLPTKHRKEAKYPELSAFFEPPFVVPEHFFKLRGPKFC